MLSTVYSSPQTAVLFSHLANMTSVINMPSTDVAWEFSQFQFIIKDAQNSNLGYFFIISCFM